MTGIELFLIISGCKLISNWAVQHDRRKSREFEEERRRNLEKNAGSNQKNAKNEDKW